MKPVKKMVVANVAIMINKDDPTQCGNDPEKLCRFLDENDGACILYSKTLKVTKDDAWKRCKPCLEAEPV